jgi:hypothetical protein
MGMNKRVYVGYLRTEESLVPKLTAIFVYKRRDKKHGVIHKVKVTIEEER